MRERELLRRIHMSYRSSASVLAGCVLALGCCAPASAAARTFGGYKCTDGCVGHATGYLWAEENEITDIDGCPKNFSVAFYEGCLVYIDDPDRGADLDDDERPVLATRRTSV